MMILGIHLRDLPVIRAMIVNVVSIKVLLNDANNEALFKAL